MATYNKRGYKPKNKQEKEKAEELQSTTAEVFNTLDEGASKTEEWVAKNQSWIFGIVGVALVAVLGYWAYGKYIIEPKQKKAVVEMTQAQSFFELAENTEGKMSDSLYGLALNGGNGQFGFIDIIDRYSGTDAANLAQYYAGVAYLKQKDYPNAIKHLDKFKGSKSILKPFSLGAIGDAFAQLGQDNDALSYYEQAFKANSNEFTTPKYLYKAALMAIKLNKNDLAKKYLDRIENEFKDSDIYDNALVLNGQVSVKAAK